MKIAIFGDSFGDDHINWIDQNRWLDVGPSWIDYLRQFHDIDNYSTGGSSLYFSKIKFDKAVLSKYDKIIFIVTSPYRRTNYDSNWNLIKLEIELANTETSIEFREKLLALRAYFIHVWNESDQYLHDLMVKDIINMFPAVLFLDFDKLNLVSDKECQKFRIPRTTLMQNGYLDARKCHLSEENNLILGKHIQHCLENNLDLNIDIEKFVIPPRELEYYFRKG
jgi:hypothetical protein